MLNAQLSRQHERTCQHSCKSLHEQTPELLTCITSLKTWRTEHRTTMTRTQLVSVASNISG